MINFRCSNCGASLTADDEDAGSPMICDNCETEVTIPGEPVLPVTNPIRFDAQERQSGPSSTQEGGSRLSGQAQRTKKKPNLLIGVAYGLGLALFGAIGMAANIALKKKDPSSAPAALLFSSIMLIGGGALAAVGCFFGWIIEKLWPPRRP